MTKENKEESKESVVRISLVDVMYGVVLAYGFSFFDQAKTFTGYFRFFFAYIVIIIDWIYVHRLYWGWEYKYNSFFLLDMSVLFTISRLLHTSTAQSPYYLLWMSILFLLYVTWDLLSKYKGLPSKYDWRYSIGGDLFGCIVFLILFLSLTDRMQSTVFWNIVMFIVYVGAVLNWFKKIPESKEELNLGN